MTQSQPTPNTPHCTSNIRSLWRHQIAAAGMELVRTSGIDTVKAVMRLPDGLEVETVHLPMGSRRPGAPQRSALCVSSQVGCARGCRFCETGRMGLLRNLTAEEIAGQWLVAADSLGVRPHTVVFQGMGEPLDNLPGVLSALRLLNDSNGPALAHHRMTVCTVGHVDGLMVLRAIGWKRLGLSLSLNAADDIQRRELMPITRQWPLTNVQRALMAYRQRDNLLLGIHWCLLPGINDTREDAARIARFCQPLGRIMVHVIPYNPGSEPLTRTPTEAEVVRFVEWLREEGLPVRRRITKGRDHMAGCGQLGNPALRRRNPRAKN